MIECKSQASFTARRLVDQMRAAPEPHLQHPGVQLGQVKQPQNTPASPAASCSESSSTTTKTYLQRRTIRPPNKQDHLLVAGKRINQSASGLIMSPRDKSEVQQQQQTDQQEELTRKVFNSECATLTSNLQLEDAAVKGGGAAVVVGELVPASRRIGQATISDRGMQPLEISAQCGGQKISDANRHGSIVGANDDASGLLEGSVSYQLSTSNIEEEAGKATKSNKNITSNQMQQQQQLDQMTSTTKSATSLEETTTNQHVDCEQQVQEFFLPEEESSSSSSAAASLILDNNNLATTTTLPPMSSEAQQQQQQDHHQLMLSADEQQQQDRQAQDKVEDDEDEDENQVEDEEFEVSEVSEANNTSLTKTQKVVANNNKNRINLNNSGASQYKPPTLNVSHFVRANASGSSARRRSQNRLRRSAAKRLATSAAAAAGGGQVVQPQVVRQVRFQPIPQAINISAYSSSSSNATHDDHDDESLPSARNYGIINRKVKANNKKSTSGSSSTSLRKRVVAATGHVLSAHAAASVASAKSSRKFLAKKFNNHPLSQSIKSLNKIKLKSFNQLATQISQTITSTYNINTHHQVFDINSAANNNNNSSSITRERQQQNSNNNNNKLSKQQQLPSTATFAQRNDSLSSSFLINDLRDGNYDDHHRVGNDDDDLPAACSNEYNNINNNNNNINQSGASNGEDDFGWGSDFDDQEWSLTSSNSDHPATNNNNKQASFELNLTNNNNNNNGNSYLLEIGKASSDFKAIEDVIQDRGICGQFKTLAEDAEELSRPIIGSQARRLASEKQVSSGCSSESQDDEEEEEDNEDEEADSRSLEARQGFSQIRDKLKIILDQRLASYEKTSSSTSTSTPVHIQTAAATTTTSNVIQTSSSSTSHTGGATLRSQGKLPNEIHHQQRPHSLLVTTATVTTNQTCRPQLHQTATTNTTTNSIASNPKGNHLEHHHHQFTTHSTDVDCQSHCSDELSGGCSSGNELESNHSGSQDSGHSTQHSAYSTSATTINATNHHLHHHHHHHHDFLSRTDFRSAAAAASGSEEEDGTRGMGVNGSSTTCSDLSPQRSPNSLAPESGIDTQTTSSPTTSACSSAAPALDMMMKQTTSNISPLSPMHSSSASTLSSSSSSTHNDNRQQPQPAAGARSFPNSISDSKLTSSAGRHLTVEKKVNDDDEECNLQEEQQDSSERRNRFLQNRLIINNKLESILKSRSQSVATLTSPPPPPNADQKPETQKTPSSKGSFLAAKSTANRLLSSSVQKLSCPANVSNVQQQQQRQQQQQSASSKLFLEMQLAMGQRHAQEATTKTTTNNAILTKHASVQRSHTSISLSQHQSAAAAVASSNSLVLDVETRLKLLDQQRQMSLKLKQKPRRKTARRALMLMDQDQQQQNQQVSASMNGGSADNDYLQHQHQQTSAATIATADYASTSSYGTTRSTNASSGAFSATELAADHHHNFGSSAEELNQENCYFTTLSKNRNVNNNNSNRNSGYASTSNIDHHSGQQQQEQHSNTNGICRQPKRDSLTKQLSMICLHKAAVACSSSQATVNSQPTTTTLANQHPYQHQQQQYQCQQFQYQMHQSTHQLSQPITTTTSGTLNARALKQMHHHQLNHEAAPATIAATQPKPALSLRQLVKDVIDDCERPSKLCSLTMSILNRSDSISSNSSSSNDDELMMLSSSAPADEVQRAGGGGRAIGGNNSSAEEEDDDQDQEREDCNSKSNNNHLHSNGHSNNNNKNSFKYHSSVVGGGGGQSLSLGSLHPIHLHNNSNSHMLSPRCSHPVAAAASGSNQNEQLQQPFVGHIYPVQPRINTSYAIHSPPLVLADQSLSSVGTIDGLEYCSSSLDCSLNQLEQQQAINNLPSSSHEQQYLHGSAKKSTIGFYLKSLRDLSRFKLPKVKLMNSNTNQMVEQQHHHQPECEQQHQQQPQHQHNFSQIAGTWSHRIKQTTTATID